MGKEEKTSFKKSAELYTNIFHSKLLNYSFKIIKKYLSKGECLVCAPSIKAEIENKLVSYKRVIFVDKNKDILEELKNNVTLKNAQYLEKNLESLSLNEKFDTILAFHILEHMDHPSYFLRSLKPLLKDKGRIILIVPNAQSFHRMLGVKMGIIKNEYILGKADLSVNHKKVYDTASLYGLLKNTGFNIIDIGGIFAKPFPNDMMEKLSDNILDGLFELGKEFETNCADIYAVVEL